MTTQSQYNRFIARNLVKQGHATGIPPSPFEQGWLARFQNKGQRSNPFNYTNRVDGESWLRGWNQANQQQIH